VLGLAAVRALTPPHSVYFLPGTRPAPTPDLPPLMLYLVAAYATFAIHLAFILFVVFGALLVLHYRWMVWLHLPSAIWGGVVMIRSWTCPLTPLEIWLLQRGGAEGYDTGFIEHYLMPLIYPESLTREVQISLGVGVVALNLVIYGLLIMAARKVGR